MGTCMSTNHLAKVAYSLPSAIHLSLSTECLTNNTSFPPSVPPLDPTMPPDYLENGRWYHGYRKETYMYPCDEVLIPELFATMLELLG